MRTEASGRGIGSRYLLRDVIGQGACGVVWSALERESGAPVAVKVLRSELADAPTMLAQFVAEAELLRTVSHPHVLAIRDVVIEGGDVAFVTDLVEGPTLRSVLDRGGPPTGSDIGVIAAQLAAGLAAVHAAGIVHADLKPQNVLLGPDGVRLADFGLAGLLDGAVNRVRGGSRGYQAPEVVRGAEPTQSADVFALGLVLYEAWTGALPRKGVPNARDRGLLAAAASGEQAESAQIVLDALAADPKRRPAARALATRLAGVLDAGAMLRVKEGSAAGSLESLGGPVTRLPAAAGRRDFGALIEQYAGDSLPTVLEDGWQRPRPHQIGVATQDYRRQRRSHGRRALLTATAVVLASVGVLLGYGGARDTAASSAADPYPAAWGRAGYPAPTGWLCSTTGRDGTASSGFRLEACVLADRLDHVIGRITAELVSGTAGRPAKRLPLDLRIRLGAANGSAELAESECAVVLTAIRPTGGCPPIDVTVRELAELRAFGSGWLHSEAESSQLVSTPAVIVQPRSVK